jgi:hypothetical protein
MSIIDSLQKRLDAHNAKAAAAWATKQYWKQATRSQCWSSFASGNYRTCYAIAGEQAKDLHALWQLD